MTFLNTPVKGNSGPRVTTYRWIRLALLFAAFVELVVIFDTMRHSRTGGGVRNTSAAMDKINGKVFADKVVNRDKAAEKSSNSEEDPQTENDQDPPGSEDNNDGNENNDGSENPPNEPSGRTVHWLKSKSIGAFHYDYYSGSWLMPVDKFRSFDGGNRITNLESASVEVYTDFSKSVRMSVDWLDFSVEHMSRWYKEMHLLDKHNNKVGLQKISGNLVEYIRATPERTRALLGDAEQPTVPLLSPTIAIISSSLIEDESSPKRVLALTISTLGATIASLLRTGVGRIVCTGRNDADQQAVTQTYQLLLEQYQGKMNHIATTEFSYVRVDEELTKTSLTEYNMPRAAIYGLQQALNGNFNETYTQLWLGNVQQPEYWKYVYFTEPDLVLQTRRAAIPAIHEQLAKGRVLMPHRLELVKHATDVVGYDGTPDFLPDEGVFGNVLELNGDEDLCCDGGKNRPTWKGEDDPTETECYTWWWNCGYTPEWKDKGIPEEVKHRRIAQFTPLFRLFQGTDIVSISGSEHQRKCHPRKRHGDEVCEVPSESGRSYATSESQTSESQNSETKSTGINLTPKTESSGVDWSVFGGK